MNDLAGAALKLNFKTDRKYACDVSYDARTNQLARQRKGGGRGGRGGGEAITTNVFFDGKQSKFCVLIFESGRQARVGLSQSLRQYSRSMLLTAKRRPFSKTFTDRSSLVYVFTVAPYVFVRHRILNINTKNVVSHLI